MVKLHLRRVMHCNRLNPQPPIPEKDKYRTLILLSGNTRVGRQLDQNDVLLHSGTPNNPHDIKGSNNMISRCHADIIHSTLNGEDEYYLFDRSLNGTYLNDVRVPKFSNKLDERVKLKVGDMVKFGHLNGAAVRACQHAPQAFSEFSFIVERANPGVNYLGFTPDGRRVCPLKCWSDTALINDLTDREIQIEQIESVVRPPALGTPGQQGQQRSRTPKPIVAPRPQQITTHAFQPPNSFYPSVDINVIYNGFLNNLPNAPLLSSSLAAAVYDNQAWANTFAKVTHDPMIAQMINVILSSINSRPPSQTLPTGETPPVDLNSFPGLLIPVNAATAAAGTVPSAPTTQPSNQPSPLVANATKFSGNVVTDLATGASPPMECDSSVPSPPKNGVAGREGGTSRQIPCAAPSLHQRMGNPSSSSSSVSPVTPSTPSTSVGNTQRGHVDDDDDDVIIIDVEDTPEESEIAAKSKQRPSNTTESPKKRPRTNELNNLLNDLTSFEKKEKRSSTVQRRPTDQDVMHKNARKRIKKTQKAMKAKNVSVPLKKRMKQLSDESSASSDSEDEIPVETQKKINKAKADIVRSGTTKDVLEEEEEEVEQTRKKNVKRASNVSPDSSDSSGLSSRKQKKKKGVDKDSCGLGDECKGKKIDGSNINWVQCDDCKQWWHVLCIFNANVEFNEDYSYSCCKDQVQTLPPPKVAQPRRGRKPK